MQKKLIALAVAGAFVAPAAFAADSNVTIYGVMSASYDLVDPGMNGGGGQRTSQVNDNASRLGFKGSEDLGNGLSAVWQIESSINADGQASTGGSQGTTGSSSTAGTLNGRNTFVGLSGKTWGTVILGRHDTPYKLATRSLDVFNDGIADNRSLMGQSGAGTTFDGRQSNVVAYISPNLNGFSFAAGYVAGAENAQTAGQKKGNAWSLMGNYSNGPWYGALAYERHNVGDATGATTVVTGPWPAAGAAAPFRNVAATTTGTLGVAGLGDRSESAWKLGVAYKANNLRVGVAYERTNDDFGNVIGACTQTSCFGHKTWYLGGGYTFGNNEVKLAYTRMGDADGFGSNTGAKQWTVGVDHNFSKRTKVFALYTKLSNDTNAGFSLTGGGNATVATNAGGAPSAWSFGMRHDF